MPAAARQRHIAMAAGGPGLFAGRRVFILAPAAGRPAIASKPPGMVHRVGQMVAAEGGTLARSLRSAAHGEGRGAASPSPSPEGGTLLLCVASSLDEAKAAIKAAQVRPAREGTHGGGGCLSKPADAPPRCVPLICRSGTLAASCTTTSG